MSLDSADAFKVWADDNAAYGPVDLATVVQWIQEERVTPDSFVQPQSDPRWRQAQDLEVLREHFPAPEAPASAEAETRPSATADELRELAVLAGVPDDGLEQLAALGEFSAAAPGDLVVKKGDPCDALYFVLSGELRVRLVIGVVDQDDKTLCKIGGGGMFGEMGMFLQGTRTADVIAETPTRLFRMTTSAFLLLVRQLPELAAPILFNISVAMAQRIAKDNERFYREVTSQFLWV